jgi:uncharacterized membrane protein
MNAIGRARVIRDFPAWLVVVCALYALVYILLDFNALYALRANQNTGLFLQSAVNLAHTGSTFDQPDGKPHMLVHDQWLVYAILTPLTMLWARPEAVIVVQVLALSAAALALYAFARTCGVARAGAGLLAIAFLIAPSMQGWTYDGFVGEDFLPLLGFALAIAVRTRSLVWTLVLAQLVLGVKEDEVWFLCWLGALGAVFYDRKLGLATLGLALCNGAAYYAIATHFGYTPEHPQYGLADREWFGQGTFILEMLVPLGFAPLRLGTKLVCALPFLAELFLAQDRSYPLYHIGSYYTIPLIVLAAIGTALVAVQQRKTAAYAFGGACAMALLFNNASILHFGRAPFHSDPQYATARAWGESDRSIAFPCEDVGAWTVAAANPNARLVGCGAPSTRAPRPAWKDEALESHAPWTLGLGPIASP